MYVTERFVLNNYTKEHILGLKPDFGFGFFSEVVYYKHYSRPYAGRMETWNDVTIRVVEGVMSIRKDHYLKNSLNWDDHFWQHYAAGFAESMFNMHWLPPGRGLWAMGTDFVYQRGSMPLYNCAFTILGERLAQDIYWLMDCSMNGVGVGFYPERDDKMLAFPKDGCETKKFIIADSREGWCESVKLLIESYLNKGSPDYEFDYSLIRKAGSPIKGFGGVASGPDSLVELHQRIRNYFHNYIYRKESYDSVMLKTDIANAVGVCVVSGNVRRSAEIACGHIDDPVFMDLKNYDIYPYRGDIGWMSNNSVFLDDTSDFEYLGEIAERVKRNGEPGFINRKNFKYGRVGSYDNTKPDAAIGINPCGEIPLENKEVCNVSESLPTRCKTVEDWYAACRYATLYMSTVSLLPTHSSETNAVVARNRRIGLSIVDFTGWKHEIGLHNVIAHMRTGYEHVTNTNRWANGEAGVPEALRKTTMKPGGTVPKVAGRTAGAGHPTFIWTLMRIRISVLQPICKLLMEAGVPNEPDVTDLSGRTLVFEFPVKQGPAKPAGEVSLWEQAFNIVTLQREWADNAVSNTLYFKPKWVQIKHIKQNIIEEAKKYGFTVKQETELTGVNYKIKIYRNAEGVPTDLLVYAYNNKHEEDEIENVLAHIAPHVKSISLLPHTGVGVYPQMPQEGISEDEYYTRMAKIKPINWGKLSNNLPEAELFCEGDKCQIPV